MKIENLFTVMRTYKRDIDSVVFTSDPSGVISINNEHFEHATSPQGSITIVRMHVDETADVRTILDSQTHESNHLQKIDLDEIAQFGYSSQKFSPRKACAVFINCSESISISLHETNSSFAGLLFIFEKFSDRPNDIWRLTRAMFDAGYVACPEIRDGDLTIAAFVRSDEINDPNLVGGRRRGLVAMSTLGTNGRFANQLFQYAALYFYALRHDLEISCPPWDGARLYGINNPWKEEEQLPELQFFAFDDDDLAMWEADSPPINVDLKGYFQEIPSCWLPHRQLLRKRFALAGELAAPLEVWLHQVTENGSRPMVAIHVRRGDYIGLSMQGLPWYRPVPEAWYLSWLEKIWPTLVDPILYIATDSPDDVIPHFSKFGPLSLRNVGAVTGLSAHEIDFEVMRRADYLAIANSSFSRMASILAQDTQVCVRPDFEASSFLDYNPWIDNQFWSRFTDGNHRVKTFGSTISAIRLRSLELRLALGQKTKAMLQYKSQNAEIIAKYESENAKTKVWHEEQIAWRDQTVKNRDEALARRDRRLICLANSYDLLKLDYKTLNGIYEERYNAKQLEIDQLLSHLGVLQRQAAEMHFLNSPRGLARRIIFRILLILLKIMDASFGRLSERFRARCRYLEGLIITRQYRATINAMLRFVWS